MKPQKSTCKRRQNLSGKKQKPKSKRQLQQRRMTRMRKVQMRMGSVRFSGDRKSTNNSNRKRMKTRERSRSRTRSNSRNSAVSPTRVRIKTPKRIRSRSRSNSRNSVVLPSAVRKKKRVPVMQKKMISTVARKQAKQKSPSLPYSPVKTRGLCKKQVRLTERCRLCKTNADGFMACSICRNKYHLECLGYAPESVHLVFQIRFFTWLCPSCTYCCTCSKFIGDPENVQCFACDKAFHGSCRPESGQFANPKDPLSSWFCPECTHLLDVENSNSSESILSSTSSRRESKSSERKSQSRHVKRDHSPNYIWKVRLQAERDVINDQLKDLCREYLEDKERGEREELKRQIERENFSPKKKIKFAARNAKKIKWSDSENELAKNIRNVGGIKISEDAKRDAVEQLSEAEKQRMMKENSSAFDYNLYMAAKREYMIAQSSDEVAADEEKPSRTQWIHFGSKLLLALYSSPYPKRIAQSSHVCICQFCLMAVEDSTSYEIHMNQCGWRHPPGNEIYRDDGLSFWEVDGMDEVAYCRRLCLLSKLFLFSKTLHHEVETFLFYILTEYTSEGYMLVGYFSKEKNPSKNNNLSCLLTLPSSQRTGYGKFLIDLSYKLSLRERKIGGPEHPLSDLGLITYRSYWKAVIFTYIREKRPNSSISIKEMSNETGVHSSDIINTMLENKMLKYRNGNYLINKKKAFTAPLFMFRRRIIHEDKLIWEPEFPVDSANKKMGTYVD